MGAASHACRDTPWFWMALWIVSWIPSTCLPRGSFPKILFPLVSTPLRALAFQSLPDNSTPVDDHGLSVLFGAGTRKQLRLHPSSDITCMAHGNMFRVSYSRILQPHFNIGSSRFYRTEKPRQGGSRSAADLQPEPLVVGDRIRGSPHTQRGGRTMDRYVSMQREKGSMCGSRPSSRHGTTRTSSPSIHL